MNHKDHSGEKNDLRVIVQESTPVAISARVAVQRESENDPKLVSVGHNIQTGDWLLYKLHHYIRVKNEFCVSYAWSKDGYSPKPLS